MARSLIGIDIGGGTCKVAIREGDSIRLVSSRMPDHMVREGNVLAPSVMAKFLKQMKSDEHIRPRDCALVLSDSQAFFRHVSLPPMSVGELKLNLPFEFRDFIEGDPDEYRFDYLVDEVVRDIEGNPQRLELYATAAKKSVIEEESQILRKAGFRPKLIISPQIAYSRLLSVHNDANPLDAGRSTVLVDIGHAEVNVVLFQGSRYQASKTIEYGCNELDNVIADMKGIDLYTANSYKISNFENVLDSDECRAVCDRMAVEVNKVVNFYNFNNPNDDVEQMYLLGGGAQITQLVTTITELISVPTQSIEAILPPAAKNQPDGPKCALALGAMLEGDVVYHGS